MWIPCSCLPRQAATPWTLQRLQHRCDYLRPFSSVQWQHALGRGRVKARSSAENGERCCQRTQRQMSCSSDGHQTAACNTSRTQSYELTVEPLRQGQQAAARMSRRAALALAAAIGMQAAGSPAEAKPHGKGASGDWSSPGLAAVEDDAAPR